MGSNSASQQPEFAGKGLAGTYLKGNSDYGDAESLLAAAQALRRSGDESGARQSLLESTQRYPSHTPLWIELAQCLAQLARLDEAAAIYGDLLAKDPRHVPSLLGLGFIAMERRIHADALEHFAAAHVLLTAQYEAEPNNIGVQRRLATVLRQLGQSEEAAGLYRTILAHDSTDLQALNGLADIARLQGDGDAALALYRSAAASHPWDVPTQINLARCLAVTKREVEAGAILRETIERAPSHARARATLGKLAHAGRNWEVALAQYHKALDLDPGNIAFEIGLARVYFDMERWDDAECLFDRVLSRTPSNADALMGLGEIARVRGRLDDALAMFERAATLNPLDMHPKVRIRRMKVKRGEFDWRTEVQEAVAIARAPRATDASQLEAARTLVQYGLTEVAAPVLVRLQAHLIEARQLLLAARELERMGLVQSLATGEAYPDPAGNQLESLKGFIERPTPGSDTLLLVFGGSNARVSITFSLMHRLLRTAAVNIVYSRDLHQDWYESGIVGLGSDFATTVDGYRKLAKRYGARRILTLGNCLGGSAALRFGLALGAEGVLGLAPRLRARNSVNVDPRAMLRGVAVKRPDLLADVRSRYTAATVRPKVTLVYSDTGDADASDARSLADLPGVAAIGIPPPSDHDTVRELLVRGLLADVLRAFVADGTFDGALRTRIVDVAATGSGR